MQNPNIPPPVKQARKPAFAFPSGATDCHAHIFGPATRFQVLPGSHFVPHDCLLADYIRMLRTVGCARAVLVQPSVYGTDNTAIAEALQSHAFEMRGVAVVAADVADRELERLHGIGYRGIRINTASGTPGLKLTDAPRLAERIRPLGWHLQFYADLRVMPELEQVLSALPVRVVIDHFARIRTAEGLQAPAFQALMRLMRREHCWAKLMGPYFVSDAVPRYPDIVPFARAMIAAAPDRIVWGSDWPHPSAK